MMKRLLAQFWTWAGIDEKAYANGFAEVCGNDFEEYMFPHWDELLEAAIQSVNTMREDEIPDVLTAMAIDNEREEILDEIAECGADAYINRLVICGASHMQPHARWQCAELIRRRRPPCSCEVLKALLNDSNAYVVKRAKNAFAEGNL